MRDPKATLNSIGIGPKSGVKRAVRVGEAVQHELSLLLVTRVRDPKLAEVSFSRVQVADDLQYARIFFTVPGGKARQSVAAEGLQKAKGFMRSHLAKVLNLRYTPELHFVYDEQAEKVIEMERILQDIARERGDANESGS